MKSDDRIIEQLTDMLVEQKGANKLRLSIKKLADNITMIN